VTNDRPALESGAPSTKSGGKHNSAANTPDKTKTKAAKHNRRLHAYDEQHKYSSCAHWQHASPQQLCPITRKSHLSVPDSSLLTSRNV